MKVFRILAYMPYVTLFFVLLSGCSSDDAPVAPAVVLATVTTEAITDITSTTATSGGNVSDTGGATVSARGVVWSTSTAPTTDLSTKTTDGTGTGVFKSLLTGLTPGTVYYVRAYAVNTTGTAYGAEVSFRTDEPFPALDDAMTAKIAALSIPAVSLAIVRNGKLVYVRAYGSADKEASTKATISDRYRIASLSKPITAVAILKLVEAGSLTLDAKVFGDGAILGNTYGAPPAGSSKDLITVRHLLNHVSGWSNSPTDPMFSDNSLTQTQLITDMLMNRPLVAIPGNREEYLNFGYCVLGRVIEKVTGVAYKDHIKSILKPMGISDMEIAGNTLADRLPHEVKYYQAEYSPYSMNVTRMDSHGGWIATATDLARILVRIDRQSSVADVVSAAVLSQMYFGDTQWYHTGSLPGTSTFMGRENDTFSFVVLANTRNENNYDQVINELYGVLITAVTARTTWPAYDLF